MTKKTINADTPEAEVLVHEAATAELQRDVPHGDAPELVVPTAEQVQSSILDLFGSISSAMTLEVERFRRVEDQSTGEETEQRDIVNRLGFFRRQLMGTVCWKLGEMLRKLDDDIATQERKIRSALSAQRGQDIGANVDGLIDWLEVLVDQRAYIGAMVEAALEAHEIELGIPYGERPKAKPITVPASDPRMQRLAQLGFKVR